MNKQLELVKKFHEKFNVPILEQPTADIGERAELRLKLIREEVEEYIKGVENHDIENITKELCDILYGVYGTILEHGLQDVIGSVFEEVHNSQMSKSYSSGKMIKGEEYKEAEISQFFK